MSNAKPKTSKNGENKNKNQIIMTYYQRFYPLLEAYKITIDNFPILVLEVMEKIYKDKVRTKDPKLKNHQVIVIMVLRQLAIDLRGIYNLEDQNLLFLLNSIPPMVYHFSALNNNKKQIYYLKHKKKAIRKGKRELKKRTFEADNEIEQIVLEIYQKIKKIIVVEEIKLVQLPVQIYELITVAMNLIQKYGDLKGLEKRQIVIRLFNHLIEHLDEIYDQVDQSMVDFLKQILSTLPNIIDAIMALINAKFEVNKHVKKVCDFLCN